MKFLPSAAVAVLAVELCSAFITPRASFGVMSSRESVVLKMAEGPKIPFFASQEEEEETTNELPTESELDSLTFEEEVDTLVKAEVKKSNRMSNLRNANGVEYAPWMRISVDEEDKIKMMMRDKAEARRKRQVQEQSVTGNLYLDSQAQELSGTGLKSKVIDGDVELEWATMTEDNTKGFIVKRRAAKTEEYAVLASFEEWGPLQSQGADGGIYRYLDTTASPGGWVYRVSECDSNGNEADLCQCLVDVQTEDEQKAGLFAAVGIVVVGIAAVTAGFLLDPYAN